MDPGLKDGLTMGIAMVGAVLGIVNIWRSIDRDRIRLKVLPQNYYTSEKSDGLSFEVVNLGFSAVTVAQVGVELSGNKFFYGYPLRHSTTLPHRLEPRASLTLYWTTAASEHPGLATGKHAFAKTACGRTFRGKSPALEGRITVARTAASKPEGMPTEELEKEMGELRDHHTKSKYR